MGVYKAVVFFFKFPIGLIYVLSYSALILDSKYSNNETPLQKIEKELYSY